MSDEMRWPPRPLSFSFQADSEEEHDAAKAVIYMVLNGKATDLLRAWEAYQKEQGE